GRPIVGGSVVARKRGPVLEEVYDLVRGQHTDLAAWEEFFVRDHYDLVCRKMPEVGLLSKFEVQTLEEVARRHREDDEWALSDFTHTLPEWKKNEPGESSRPISLSDILEAVRPADREAIVREAALAAR